jgi:hypothetical protein
MIPELLLDLLFNGVSQGVLGSILSGLLELLEEDPTFESTFSNNGYETCPENAPLIFACGLRPSGFGWDFEADWAGEELGPALRLFRADAEKVERGGRAGEVLCIGFVGDSFD